MSMVRPCCSGLDADWTKGGRLTPAVTIKFLPPSLQEYSEPAEKAMAPHSRTLAWKIPGTEEPGGLQSMGSPESDMTEAT